MTFDSDTRTKLAKVVDSARSLLLDEFTKQLQETYGIQPNGDITPLEKLTHLDDERKGIATLLRERIEHLESGLTTDKNPKAAAVDRLLREQAFTVLNRFAALRMCEERDLLRECVRGGINSKGFQVFLKTAGTGLGETYDKYRTYLNCIFDEVAIDLGVLFDRFSPLGLLFPREPALLELLEILNNKELEHIWAQDEAIGWVYQYFNPPAERKAMRDASQAPRNSRELAVRNQFFTPRYVVEFLTDNTLGRIWYEMRKGETRLKEECEFFVIRPTEIFLEPEEEPPASDNTEEDRSQEELLKKPVYIPHRPKKDPRDLKILDPACGSGHFLLYAFDLLETIYKEVWEDEDSPPSEVTGKTLHDDYESREELSQALPGLILRHNLHGIDIDPRAVQIAALALWLRAQRAYQNMGLKPQDRPPITKTNLVCAEPMPGEMDMLQEFTSNLKPTVLGQVVEVVFEKMKLAGEAGSLLKIEEEIQQSIESARRQWVAESKKEQKALFPELEEKKPAQGELFDVTGITGEKFWDQAEDRILEALQDYAEQTETGPSNRRRLFAEDAAQGFAFIDLCHKRYDVVLMNPPFGNQTLGSVQYLASKYDYWNRNLLCAFVIRAYELVTDSGSVGGIFDRTFAIKSSYEEFRVANIDSHIWAVADTGWSVLDANVETIVCVFRPFEKATTGVFYDVREVPPNNKGDSLESNIREQRSGVQTENTYLANPSAFVKLPNAIVGYYFSDWISKLFKRWPTISEAGLQARKGHDFVSDEHFRLFWEIEKPDDVGKNKHFCTVYNGAEFNLFAAPLRDVVVYGEDGHLAIEHPSTLFRNKKYQFAGGIGYGKRGEILDAHCLCKVCVFTSEGLAITNISDEDALLGLAYLNSTLAQYLINLFCGQHKQVGYVNKLPFPRAETADNIIDNTRQILCLERECYSRDETTLLFSYCLGLANVLQHTLLRELFYSLANNRSVILDEIRRRVGENDAMFENVADLSNSGRNTLRAFGESRSIGIPWPDQARSDEINELSLSFLIEKISYILGSLFLRWDIRIAEDPTLAPDLADPFDTLPVCPPGMLIGPDGLPAKPGGIVSEEWLRARPNAITLPPDGSVCNPTIADSDYPLRASWNGILVDDTGTEGDYHHPDDIIGRVREVLDLLWEEKADAIEQEACEILKVSSLRDYFRKPTGFFQDHLKRYSKSRRKAPIYWPLSTPSGSYTLWIYYHRLTDQTLFTCVNDYVKPRLGELDKEIERLQKDMTENSNSKQRQKLEAIQDFRQELEDFKEELLRIAALPYKPDLNDGVLITASSLHNLFRLPSWKKDLKSCWDKLESGDYDWAHLAYSLWPDRVREKCKTERSLAIAHGLEEVEN